MSPKTPVAVILFFLQLYVVALRFKHFISDNKAAKKVLRTFSKRPFKMRRKSRKRFGNLKCAAKVEKENSCSPHMND